ncbi:MAG: DUF4363 family protein [Clostridia bacterium]|nr:DUF4363 family protein [Clostridia bacterium]
MKKSLIICIVIVLLIVLGDTILQRYVNNKFYNITEKLNEIGDNYENHEENLRNIHELNEILNSSYQIMACYLEHNELEKVKTQLIIMEAAAKVDDFDVIYEETSRTKYIIEHINEKQSLKIDNIF